MKILGAFLLAFAVTASAQLRETAVSTPTLGRAEGDQGGPLAATNGTDFFAVWNDARGGGTFGTRVAADGRVLDPTGIFITASQPRALLWCGDAYVLVYSASDNRSAGVVRINTEGKVIDGPRNVTQSYVAAAATNGSTIVLAGTNITVLNDRAQFIEQIAPPIAGGYAWAATSNGATYELAAALYSGGLNWVAAIALDRNGHTQKVLYFGSSANQVLVTPSAAGYRVFYGDLQKDTVMTFDTATDPAP
ncbi:MAG TPA: hypothetical protein VHU41_09415, partial [Thermoanaerobaculia bacterium]|nr:hypothetical protein [Thermoanaerobaculia bacterium]